MSQVADPNRPVDSRSPGAVVDEESLSVNERIAAWITKRLGSMWVVYFTIVFMSIWMALATFGPLHKADPYPFPFLLFMGNVVQLLLVFVILVGQQVLGKSADRRAVQTFEDAEAILKEVEELHAHLEEQNKILNRGIALVEIEKHPWIEKRRETRPPRVEDEHVGVNGRIAAWITRRVGSMWAFYAATVFQFGWIGLAELGVISFDPYPFAFLLFISSLLQLIFMFVIMVGQDVLGKAGVTRAQQTYLDAEAILHECTNLQKRLTAQDTVIVKICEYVAEHAEPGHPVHGPHHVAAKT